jgi:hypothetical protein
MLADVDAVGWLCDDWTSRRGLALGESGCRPRAGKMTNSSSSSFGTKSRVLAEDVAADKVLWTRVPRVQQKAASVWKAPTRRYKFACLAGRARWQLPARNPVNIPLEV